MIASVHVADLGAFATLRLSAPKPSKVPGLRNAHAGVCAPLGAGLMPKPMFGRAATICLWDDESSLDAFLASGTSAAETLQAGVTIRMEPIRAYGSWDGLPTETEKRRAPDTDDGPVAVLTLGYLKLKRAVAFLKASAAAEGQVVDAPGVIWTMGLTDVPKRFVATISLWESAEATMDYAFKPGGHAEAMKVRNDDGFHKQDAFVRFRPYASEGQLDKTPALSADWLTAAQGHDAAI